MKSGVKRYMAKPTNKQSFLVKNSGKSKELPLKPEVFRIPDSLLAQINECSANGFILIAADSAGNPQVYSRFDSGISALGLMVFGHTVLQQQVVALKSSTE